MTEPASPTTARLVAHGALLWILLVLLTPLVSVSSGPLISDEGALILQMDELTESGSWRLDYLLYEYDPEGRFVPFGSARFDQGELSPYASRPAYVAMNASLRALAGDWGPVGLGALAVASTAILVAVATRLLQPDAALLALWLTGLATPLLFHTYVLQGHPIGALGTAAACAIAIGSARLPWRSILCPAAAVAFVFFATGLVRRESALVAVAFLVCTAVAARRRDSRPLLALGVGALLGGSAGVVTERLIMSAAFGALDAPPIPVADEGVPIIEGRVATVFQNVFSTGYEPNAVVDILALLGMVLIVVGAAVMRKASAPTLLLVGLATASLSALVRTAVFEVPPTIPGLLIAAPLLVGGVLLVPVTRLRTREGEFLMFLAALSGALVLATQYPVDWNWGGRFLTVTLPPLAVIAALGWRHAVRGLERPQALALATTACVTIAALALTSVAAHREGRQTASEAIETVRAQAPGDVLVLTTLAWLPRYDTTQYGEVDHRWAYSTAPMLGEALDWARTVPTDGVVLVVPRSAQLEPTLGDHGWTVESGPAPLPRLRTAVDAWVIGRES